MRLDRWMLVLLTALGLAVGGAAPAMGRLVYLGQDPSCHFTELGTQGTQLATNAIQWVAQNTDPSIVAVDVDACNVTTLMASTSFTNVNVVLAANLPSTDLSGVQAVYVGAFFDASTVPGFAAAIQAFVAAGGGLVVEGSQSDWSAYPFGLAVGPANNYSNSDLVTIVNPAHPVMAGLTNIGLSNWGSSIHQDFSSPEAAGFTTLTIDDSGTAVDIALGPFVAGAPTLTAPGLGALCLLLLGSGACALRRRTSQANS